mgnify:CR=1 FL=1
MSDDGKFRFERGADFEQEGIFFANEAFIFEGDAVKFVSGIVDTFFSVELRLHANILSFAHSIFVNALSFIRGVFANVLGGFARGRDNFLGGFLRDQQSILQILFEAFVVRNFLLVEVGAFLELFVFAQNFFVVADDSVQKFVDAFRSQRCAMVVGTYRMTDFQLNTIPPGVIDHREWTPDNGRNNALRVNGLGAPRGFWIPVVRKIGFPIVKYGEDYALGLRISRDYRIGRIYDVIYDCRRWDDNSDAALDVEKVNANDLYKDRLRTWELKARIGKNRKAKKM